MSIAAFAPRRVPFPLVWLPAGGAALGASLIGVQYLGVGQRPFPATIVFAAGIASALIPLRFGLPSAAVLAAFDTTISDFLGAPGRYWKEAFAVALVARALRSKELSGREIAAVAGVAAVIVAYVATGTSLIAAGWALKILLFSVVVAWGIVRLRPTIDDWIAVYYALGLVAAAALILGVWQRLEGWNGLDGLGLPYGARVRHTPTGTLRAFGGSTTSAPYAYTLALITLVWVGFLIGDRRSRTLALRTSWVPVAALTGVALSLDRIAFAGVGAAVLLLAVRTIRNRRAVLLLAVTAAAFGLPLLIAGPQRSFLLEGLTLDARSVKTRVAFWHEYGRRLTAVGYGPATAGAAYQRWHRPKPPPLEYGSGWYPLERDPRDTRFRWMRTQSLLWVGKPGRPRRPVRLSFHAASADVARTLVLRVGGAATRARVPPAGAEFVSIRVRGGTGRIAVQLRATPPAARPVGSPADPRRISIRAFDMTVADAGPPRNVTERVYAAVKRRVDVETLQGTTPGLVDNLYLSWLFQYGVLLGAALCTLWAVILLRPSVATAEDGLAQSARLCGLFLVIAALAVNVWEEFPTDFIAAIVFGHHLGRRTRGS